MVINKENTKRLMIYYVADKKGIVDTYIPYFLAESKKSVDDILIVCSNCISSEDENKLTSYGRLIKFENNGIAFNAYKAAFEILKDEDYISYDEIIAANSEIMGPVYSLEETFALMNNRDLDFWGITMQFGAVSSPFEFTPYGYLPNHLEFHFVVFRKDMVMSQDFKDYWSTLPVISTLAEEKTKYEAVFTGKFEELGFKWGTSLELEDLKNLNRDLLLMCPKKLLEEQRCPIFKKESFYHNHSDMLYNTSGEATPELLRFIEEMTDYNQDMIWETILRSANQYDIAQSLCLTYMLSDKKYYNAARGEHSAEKIALVIHLYFIDLLEESYGYVSSMPEDADIYITTDTEEKKRAIEEYFAKLQCHRLEVRLIENRGRDVSSILVGVKDIILDYDIVCFAHDKKTTQIYPGTVGVSFAYKCFENTLGSKVYVENVINTFIENPRLGMLSPPEPNHGSYFHTIGEEWGPNFDVTMELAKKLKLTVSIDKEKPPITAFGSMFWFRPKAMKRMYDVDWQYTDFPEEPLAVDGTISHAVERIRSFVVQEDGYYPAIVMSDYYAAMEYTGLRYYLGGYNKTMKSDGIGPFYEEKRQWLDFYTTGKGVFKTVIMRRIKLILKKFIPQEQRTKMKEAYKRKKDKNSNE